MEIVKSGRWRYAADVHLPVDIVSLPYDFWYELAKDDEQLEPDETPQALTSEGVLFYVRFRRAGEGATPTWPDSAGYPTLQEAMNAAERRVPAAIVWDP